MREFSEGNHSAYSSFIFDCTHVVFRDTVAQFCGIHLFDPLFSSPHLSFASIPTRVPSTGDPDLQVLESAKVRLSQAHQYLLEMCSHELGSLRFGAFCQLSIAVTKS